MCITKRIKRLVLGIMVVCTLAGGFLGTQAYANTTKTPEDARINTVDVSVPERLSLEKGKESQYVIKSNKGIFKVDALTAKAVNGWTMVDKNTDFARLNKDAKKFSLVADKTHDMVSPYSNLGEISVGADKTVGFRVDTGASTGVQNEKIAEVVATVTKKETTYELVDGKTFNSIIRNAVPDPKRIAFVDEKMPEHGTEIKGLDADGDGGVVGWYDGRNTIYVSTQKQGQKVIMNEDSSNMFYELSWSLTDVDFRNVDSSNVKDMSWMFYNCTYLRNGDFENLSTENVISFKGMFSGCTGAKTLAINNWDVSKATNMYAMFDRCKALTDIDVSRWNVSSVTDMGEMFHECEALQSLDVSNWNTKNLVNARSLFARCYSLIRLDVSKWDTRKVENMATMFYFCNSLTNLDVSNFVTDNVNTMYAMFCDCPNLLEIDVSKWNTANVTNIHAIFDRCRKLKTIDVSKWNTSNVKEMSAVFYECDSLESVDISKWDSSKASEVWGMFFGCKAMKEIDMSSFDISNVSSIREVFYGCNNLAKIKTPKNIPKNVDMRDITSKTFYDETGKEYLAGTFPTGNTNSICLTSENPIKGYNLADGSVFNQKLRGAFEDMANHGLGEPAKIRFCTNPYELGNIDDFLYTDFSKEGDGSILGGPIVEDLSLYVIFPADLKGKIVASSESNMMFYAMDSLINIEFGGKKVFDGSNIVNMEDMFSGNIQLSSVDFSDVEVSKVRSMSSMFDNCRSLTTIAFPNFNTTDLVDMSGMFNRCYYLDKVDLSNFDASRVFDMSKMFMGCIGLKEIYTPKNILAAANISSITSRPFKNIVTGEKFPEGTFPTGNTESIHLVYDGRTHEGGTN